MAIVLNRGGEAIAQMLKGRAITELPALGQVLERHYEEVAAIEGQPFIESEKQRRRAIVHDATVADLDRELEKAIKARSREFDQQRGQARAAARGDEWIGGPALPTAEESRQEEKRFRCDQALTSEWNLLLANVPNINDHAALERLAADVALTNNPRIYRAVMQAITQQSGLLAAAEHQKNVGGPIGRAQIAHSAMSGDLASWLKANPTPSERLQQIDNEQQRHEDDARRSAQLYLRAYGFGSAY